jgi:hypothetical protein
MQDVMSYGQRRDLNGRDTAFIIYGSEFQERPDHQSRSGPTDVSRSLCIRSPFMDEYGTVHGIAREWHLSHPKLSASRGRLPLDNGNYRA